MEIVTSKNYIIKERNLNFSLNLKETKNLKQVLNPKDISSYDINKGQTKTFVSPYARKNKTAESTIKYEGPYKSAYEQLNECNDNNTQMDGWSAQDVVKMREELCSAIKPETYEALKKLQDKKKNMPRKAITKEEVFLSKVKEECLKATEEISDLKDAKIDTNDLSFMPITPNNKLLHMDKVEVDKLEWMRQVDIKVESAKSLAIRFHMNGQVIQPDIGMGEVFMTGNSEEFDPYLDSLRHHGDEPGREGYTINELFWLSRSSFAQQRHLAVNALIKIIQTSQKLQHAHQFNVISIEQNLVDCGVLFLARWLIDDAGLRENHLEDALKLLSVVIVSEDNDKWLINWPELRIAMSNPRLMSKSSSEEERSRNKLPISERTELQDDILMGEDIISCLVQKTHLLTRFSWLVVIKKFSSYNIDIMIIKILQRIAAHSLEMASVLCNEHEDLLTSFMKSHLNVKSNLLFPLLRLLRLVANSSQSMAYKITKDKKIISIIYDVITESNLDIMVQTEAVRLAAVLVHQDIHLGPIVQFTPILLESFIMNMDNPNMSLYIQTVAMFLSCLIVSNVNIPPETYNLMIKAVTFSKSYVKSMIKIELNFHVTSTIIHFCNTFFYHQYYSSPCSSSEVAINYWTDFVYPILQSNILPVIYQQVSFNTILGYEHSNKNLKLVKLDLHNLLQYSTYLAIQTANPNYVDLKPFFIGLHQSVPILSAISHTLLSMFDTKLSPALLPNFSNAFSDLINNEYLVKYLTKVSESSYDTIVPSSSPHSLIVQLELETLTQVILTIAGISSWTEILLPKAFATIIYKTAIRILPRLGPDLQFLAHKLVHVIIFSPSIISVVATSIPQDVKTLLLSQLPAIKILYIEHISSFQQAIPSEKKVTSQHSIDHFNITHDWIDLPISELYTITKQIPDALVNTESMMNCLTFIMFLEFDKILPVKQAAIVGLYRLSYLLTSIDWIDTLSDVDYKLVVSSLLEHYLSQPSLININVTYKKTMSFYNIYDDLLLKYFFDSLSDTKMANIVMFPCAMRFPLKYRQYLWGEYIGNVRLLTLDVSESMLPIEEYLSPEEVNDTLLLCYWRAIKEREICLENNPLLYWISLHHLNRFIYNQTLTCGGVKEKDRRNIQINFVNYISHEASQSKPWVQHIQFYKQFDKSDPQFYDNIPHSRRDHLERIRSSCRK